MLIMLSHSMGATPRSQRVMAATPGQGRRHSSQIRQAPRNYTAATGASSRVVTTLFCRSRHTSPIRRQRFAVQ